MLEFSICVIQSCTFAGVAALEPPELPTGDEVGVEVDGGVVVGVLEGRTGVEVGTVSGGTFFTKGEVVGGFCPAPAGDVAVDEEIGITGVEVGVEVGTTSFTTGGVKGSDAGAGTRSGSAGAG
jgi:hypothetical protein